MDKRKIQRIILIILVIAFLAWAAYYWLYSPNTELFFDKVFGAIIVAFILLVNEKANLHPVALALMLVALGLHNAKLYGYVIYGIQADRIIHFIAAFAMALFFYNYFYSRVLKKGVKINRLELMVLMFFFVSGIAASSEILEFVGYSYLGEGEGLFAYGAGDWGEWNNISWDLICNSIGALAGVMIVQIPFIKKWLKG